jgi:hypothetical protein
MSRGKSLAALTAKVTASRAKGMKVKSVPTDELLGALELRAKSTWPVMLTPPLAGKRRVPMSFTEALSALTPSLEPFGRLNSTLVVVRVRIVAVPVALYEPMAEMPPPGEPAARPFNTS